MSYLPSALLRMYLIDNLTEEDTWGILLNDNWRRLEQSVAGLISKPITSTDITLNDTAFSPTVSESHFAILLFTGVQSANVNCIIPNRAKHYFIVNNTTSLDSNVYTITVKTAAGSGIVYKHGINGSLVCLGNDTVESITKTDSLSSVEASGRGQIVVSNNNNVYVSFAPTFPTHEGYVLKAREAVDKGLAWEELVLPTIDPGTLPLDRLVTGPEGNILVRDSSGNLVDTNPLSFLNLIPPDSRIEEIATDGQGTNILGNLGFIVRTTGNKLVEFGVSASSVSKVLAQPIPLLNSSDDITFKKVFCNSQSYFAIDSEDKVWAWGGNAQGCLGLGHTNVQNFPVKISALSAINIEKVVVVYDSYNNYGCTYFLEKFGGSDLGRLYAAGINSNGNLGNNSVTNSSVPVQCGSLTGIIGIASGGYPGYNNVFAWSQTKLWSWGENTYGALGTGDTVQKNSPVEVLIAGSPVTDVLHVSALSRYHAILLVSNPTNNKVYAAGYGAHYALGLGTNTNQNRFQEIPSANIAGENPIMVYTAGNTAGTTAIRTEEKNIWLCGYNNSGVCGNGAYTNQQTLAKPIGTNFANKVQDFMFGGYGNVLSAVVLTDDNRLWVCGYNSEGSLGLGPGVSINRNTYEEISKIPGTIVQMAMAYNTPGNYANVHLKLLYDNGKMYGCGANDRGQNSVGHLTDLSLINQCYL